MNNNATDHKTASQVFKTWSYESDKPFALETLKEMVRRELPATVFRRKGIIYAADQPGKRLTLQAVGRRTEVHELDEKFDRCLAT